MCHFKLTTYDLYLNLKARFSENMILNSVNSLTEPARVPGIMPRYDSLPQTMFRHNFGVRIEPRYRLTNIGRQF